MLPTVLELSDRGAIVLLLSHFGRPKGEVRPDMSTAQLVLPLHRLTGRSVRFIEDCQGPEAERAITTMLPGNIGILENTRFHAGEEKNDPELAQGDGGARRLSTSTTPSRPRTAPMPRPRASRISCRALPAGRWRPS